MSQERELWHKELLSFKESLQISPVLPRESTYELQHALNHLLIGYRRQSRTKEIEKAIGHLRRAHLDYLKIQIFFIQERLFSQAGFAQAELCANFQQQLMKARVDELCSVGTNHEQTIQNYRQLIAPFANFLPQHNQMYTPALNGGLRANSAPNFSLLTSKEEDLLWEWAQLELLLTSIKGQRIYDVVFNMVDTYLRDENFADALCYQNASLKVLLLETAFSMDLEGLLAAKLSSVPQWGDRVEPNLEQAFQGNIEALNIIKEEVHIPFAELLTFWGMSLAPLKI